MFSILEGKEQWGLSMLIAELCPCPRATDELAKELELTFAEHWDLVKTFPHTESDLMKKEAVALR